MLANCEQHDHCLPLRPKPLPTRVIHIGQERPFPKIHLHVTPKQGQVGQYVALSYCWGGPQQVRLTTNNLQTFQAGGLDGLALPQTLQDAILTTQYMGFEFLWVDTLCIIQDDDADKQHEIGRMCSIYEDSALCIAAATSSSVNDGFLKPTSTFSERYPSREIQVPIPNNRRHGTLTLVPPHSQQTGHFPINKRGWTFQEALIPPRLLVFGDLEPFLRCRSRDASPISRSFVKYPPTRIQPRRVVHDSVNSGYDRDHDPRNVWRTVVEAYTLRHLSFAEDRPLAVQGVIDFLSKTFVDQCYFGVWKSFPVGCLLWTVGRGRKSVRIPKLPTWSWMSVTGEVDMDQLEFLGSDAGEALVKFDNAPPHDRLHLTCSILNEAEVRRFNCVKRDWPDMVEEEEQGNVGVEDDSQTKTASVDGKGCREGLVRYLLVMSKSYDGRIQALVVTRHKDNMYQRCGLAEIKSSNKWLSVPKEEIFLL